jgi:hypothetical protein
MAMCRYLVADGRHCSEEAGEHELCRWHDPHANHQDPHTARELEHYIQQELTMRRLQLPRWSTQRFTSWIVDLFCGYGEAPMRVVLFSLLLIFICSIFYFFFGLSFNGNHLIYQPGAPLEQNAIFLLECLYYSVVTFTTLGYGDFTPIGLSRIFAAFEAFTGSFTLALFVVVFVKKMTR